MQRGTDLILFVGGKAACCAYISSRHQSNFCRVKSNLFLITQAVFERHNVTHPWDNVGAVLNKNHCLIFVFRAKKSLKTYFLDTKLHSL